MTDLAVRTVRPDDYEQIERLKREYGLGAYTRAEWCHLFEGNPLFRKRPLDWPWGWVLESSDGAIHGHLGNIPVEYSFRGRTIAAAAASDWVVEPDHRGHSLQLVLNFFRQSEADVLLNTTASENYGRAYEKLGAHHPPGTYDRNVLWPINRRRFAVEALHKLGLPSNAMTSSLVTTALVPVTAVRQAATWVARRGAPVADVCREFDRRFDALWHDIRSDEGLLCVRNAEALRWRFGRGLSDGRVWVHTLGNGVAHTAYMLLAKSSDDGLSRVRLIDYQDRRPTVRRAAALLASIARRCQHEGVDAVQAVGLAPDTRRRLAVLGGYPRRMASLMYYFRAMDPELQAVLEQPGGWRPGPYDGDGHCGTPAYFGLGG